MSDFVYFNTRTVINQQKPLIIRILNHNRIKAFFPGKKLIRKDFFTVIRNTIELIWSAQSALLQSLQAGKPDENDMRAAFPGAKFKLFPVFSAQPDIWEDR